MKYFSIRDTKTPTFNPQLFAANSIVDATRHVQMALEDGKSTLAKFPQDFQLTYIGDFDPITGMFTQPSPQGPLVIQEVSAILSDSLLGKAQSVGNLAQSSGKGGAR